MPARLLTLREVAADLHMTYANFIMWRSRHPQDDPAVRTPGGTVIPATWLTSDTAAALRARNTARLRTDEEPAPSSVRNRHAAA